MLLEDDETFKEVLKNNYNWEITDEDPVYIAVMVSRLRRILNWNLEDENVIFQRQGGVNIIRDIMTHFTRWKSFVCNPNNLADIVGMQHFIIFSLAKLSFYYWIEDSDTVAEILSQVYSCDGHFSSMLSHIVNRYDRRPLWPPHLQERENLTMLFFVSHAHEAKLHFDGMRFVDLRLRTPIRVPPTVSAAIYNKPKLLLILLRFGALLQPQQEGMIDDWDLHMLLRHLTRILWASFGTQAQQSALANTVISNTLYDVCQCLRILLRSVRQIKMGELNFSLMNFDQNGLTVTSSSHEFIQWVSEADIVSKLASRYLEPSELQHLCRVTIRDALNANWNLPYGIFSLPLPRSLKYYLNLSED